MKENNKTIFALVGCTCTYKTEISIELAEKYNFEIISADSRLIYKEMNIGTAKPTLEERKNIPHHMIDLIYPNENYSVALYKNESEDLIKKILSKNKSPLFVGGTGLYLNSILSGFSIPEVEADIVLRNKLNNECQGVLYDRLLRVDSEAAKKINKNDKLRTIRALEVIEKTGKLFSDQKIKTPLSFKVIWIGLNYENRTLHSEKISLRTKKFLKNGFLDEVNFLLKKYGELDIFKNTIGYAEGIEYLKNKISKDDLIEKITISTRQYAKRQRTWFRGNKEIKWVFVDNKNVKDIFKEVTLNVALEEV